MGALNLSRYVTAGMISGIAFACASNAMASVIFNFSDPINYPGLAAQAEFDLLNPTTLEIRFKNTSTGVPDASFSGAGQILTGLSWDFDPPGSTADTSITGGTVIIGPTSQTINFDTGSYGPGTNVSGEWGFGNMDGTGALWNFITSSTSAATQFPGPNLDGPASKDGPQAGLVASPLPISLGGQGAIQNEVIATLTLSDPIDDLSFLDTGVRVEFGSDAAFIDIPEPGTIVLLLLGSAGLVRRRASCA